MRRALTLFGAFLAAIAVGAGATIAVYAALSHDSSTKTVIREVTVPSANPVVNESGLTVAQIYQRAYKGVVEITVNLNGGGAQGSGFVYDSSGHVVTNDHVVDGASSIEVEFPDGSSYSGDARRKRSLHRPGRHQGRRACVQAPRRSPSVTRASSPSETRWSRSARPSGSRRP